MGMGVLVKGFAFPGSEAGGEVGEFMEGEGGGSRGGRGGKEAG